MALSRELADYLRLEVGVSGAALLLTQLASVSMTDMAREISLPRAEAERLLQTATAIGSQIGRLRRRRAGWNA